MATKVCGARAAGGGGAPPPCWFILCSQLIHLVLCACPGDLQHKKCSEITFLADASTLKSALI